MVLPSATVILIVAAFCLLFAGGMLDYLDTGRIKLFVYGAFGAFAMALICQLTS